jgi:radical SAM protein with 4Fe4S-binding SPASM domain
MSEARGTEIIRRSPRDAQGPPAFLWVALTNRCNLRCRHCQRPMLAEQGVLEPRDMSEELFEKLEAEVFPYLKRIQFGGNNFGEQLLASKWDVLFERVRRMGISISVVTNGTRLDASRIARMVGAGVEFNFSLEGASKESYEANRGAGFEGFLEVVTATCREKNGRPTGSKVNLGFTAFRDNVEEIPDVIRLAGRVGGDRVTVTHFIPWREDQRKQSLVSHKSLAEKVFGEARSLALELGLTVDIPEPFHAARSRQESEPLKPCYHPFHSASVNENGDIMPCCASSVVMGNVGKQSFHEIWNGWRYRRLRETVNTDRPLGFCRNCGLRGIEVGSRGPLAFCSDENILLASIGTGDGRRAYPFLMRSFRNALGRAPWGKRLIPRLTGLYRSHVAFTMMGRHRRGDTAKRP